MLDLKWISIVRRAALVAGIVSLLAGCSALSDDDEFQKPRSQWASAKTFHNKNYPKKGDNDPHPGVARVHKLPVHGIDVSRWQADIHWPSVKDAGTRFAFIKATEGADHIDPKFRENWRGAGAAGVPRAAYHFMYWCSPASAQADWFIRNVPRDPNGLPPVIDAEWVNKSRTCKRRVPREEALRMVRTVSARLEAHYGKIPIIYTDINFHRDVLEGERFDNVFWLRSTAAEPHERYRDRRWAMWQWTQTGTVPGIRGEVDRNAFYGSEREWASFLATGCDPRDKRMMASSRCAARDAGPMIAAAPPPPAIEETASITLATATTAPPLPGVAEAPIPPHLPAVEAYAAEPAASVSLEDLIDALD
jgi:lysozyme